MSQVYTYQNTKQYSSGKPNTVLKSADISWRAFQVIKGDGSLTVVIGMRFGKNPETGKPQIAIMDSPKIGELFTECPKPLYDQIVSMWEAEDKPTEALNTDTDLGRIDVGELP